MTTFFLQNSTRIGPFEVWPIQWSGPELSSIRLSNEGDLGFYELDQPDPNTIIVSNSTNEELLLPAGQIIGGLRQTRMVPDAVLVPANSNVEFDVFCVEQGRFHSPVQSRMSGRAPISVLLAGRSIVGQRNWGRGSSGRQNFVWDSVRRQESRSGARPTSSLEQVMKEDQVSLKDFREVMEQIDANLRMEASNGFAISCQGEPLMLEVFATKRGVDSLVRETLVATLFDLPNLNFNPTEKSRIESLLLRLGSQKFDVSETLQSGVALSNSEENLECHVIMDSRMKLVNTIILNRNHDILQEV
jgi:hypothetical protein